MSDDDPVGTRATRPVLGLPRPRRATGVAAPSAETVERARWLSWVAERIADTTECRDPWNDPRWDDWGLLPGELSFEAWRRTDRAARM